MNNRYKLMSKVGVRNIDGYNTKHKLKMPYIVVVVDEMSDLMLLLAKKLKIIFKNYLKWLELQEFILLWQHKDQVLM